MKPIVYLQGADGEDIKLKVTQTSPVDKTWVAHFPANIPDVSKEEGYWWIRIIPGVKE